MTVLNTGLLSQLKTGFADVKTLFDTLSPSALSTWTPTLGYNGTSITLDTINSANYVLAGPLMWLSLHVDFTLVGSGTQVTATLPESVAGGFVNVAGHGNIISTTPMALFGYTSGGTMTFRHYVSTSWTAGSRYIAATGYVWIG